MRRSSLWLVLLFLQGACSSSHSAASPDTLLSDGGRTLNADGPRGPEQVVVPLFSPPALSAIGPLTITIASATSGAVIHVTSDGSEPTEQAPVYSAPLTVSTTTTLKARAFATGLTPSPVATATYTIGAPAFASLYQVNPTKYVVLDGVHLPAGAAAFGSCAKRVARGEYEPCSFLLAPKATLHNVRLSWTDFAGSSRTLPASTLDPYVVKPWWQAAQFGQWCPEVTSPVLVQELLLKDNALVVVDPAAPTNQLRVIPPGGGAPAYVNVSTVSTAAQTLAEGSEIRDTTELQPFDVAAGRYQQLWLILHVPADAAAGSYTSLVTLAADEGTIGTFPVTLQVLPFALERSPLVSSIYYTARLSTSSTAGFANSKTLAQYRAEMRDLAEHGVLYPTSYLDVSASSNLWDGTVQARKDAGLPTDRFFYIDLTLAAQSDSVFTQTAAAIKQLVQVTYGYQKTYVYGIDEAGCSTVQGEYAKWRALHDLGMAAFVAIAPMSCDPHPSQYLDAPVIYGVPETEAEVARYIAQGHEPFVYAIPQAGWEGPEVYRVNFGLYAWRAGYKGTMPWAYQYGRGLAWNDFDKFSGSTSNWGLRDEMMTYPTTDGVISTVQWESYREGQDDLRYLATLLRRIKELGNDPRASVIQAWVDGLAVPRAALPGSRGVDLLHPAADVGTSTIDLDAVRGQIIDKILATL